jgi:hypothetical protein
MLLQPGNGVIDHWSDGYYFLPMTLTRGISDRRQSLDYRRPQSQLLESGNERRAF